MPNYLFSIKSISLKISNPAESQESSGIREDLPSGLVPVAYRLLSPLGARPAFPNLNYVNVGLIYILVKPSRRYAWL